MFQNTFLCSLIVLVFMMASSAYAGKVELTTYYPAPMGEYDTLKSNKLAVGSAAVTPAGDGDVTITGTLTLGNYALPSADGTDGQVLRTNGAGTLSWGSSSSPVCKTFYKYGGTVNGVDGLSASCSEFESNAYPVMVSGGCFFSGEAGTSTARWRMDNCSWPSYGVGAEAANFPVSGTGEENTWNCADKTGHADVYHAFVRCCK